VRGLLKCRTSTACSRNAAANSGPPRAGCLKTTDREKLEVEIRNNLNDSLRSNKSVWLLETVLNSPGIKARLLQFMANGDCLIISRLAAQVAVQALADDGSTWLDSKGIRVL